MNYNSSYYNSHPNLKRRYYLCKILAEHKQKKYLDLFEQLIHKKYNNVLITDLYESCFGYTKIIEYLNRKSKTFVGMDISKNVLCNTKHNISGHNILLSECDARNLSFKNNTFDLIISPSTLDHFPEIDKAIYEIRRVLKNDSIFILALNNKHNFLFMLNVFFLSLIGLLPSKIEKCYFFYEVEKLLKKHGLIIQNKNTLMHVPFLFPTILHFAEKFRLKIFVKILYTIILKLEKLSKKHALIGRVFGWWIIITSKKMHI